jgi:hypothetical protein
VGAGSISLNRRCVQQTHSDIPAGASFLHGKTVLRS